jgi:hypothetical protein
MRRGGKGAGRKKYRKKTEGRQDGWKRYGREGKGWKGRGVGDRN